MVFVFFTSQAQEKNNCIKYAKPFIGASGEGNIFPGATVPFGMVKLGPDCYPPGSNQGYIEGGKVKGFSHIHVSGTGGGIKYGNILVMPINGDINLKDYRSNVSGDSASPGYFMSRLSDYKVKAELSASHSVGFHQYTFSSSKNSKILIDAGHVMGEGFGFGESQELLGSEIKILSDSSMEGYTRVRGGWNYGKAYTVYFYALFDTKAKAYGTWKDSIIHPNEKEEFDNGKKCGAYFSFSTKSNQKIKVKVGISWLGTGKAKENLINEINHWNFDNVVASAQKKWNDELSKIQVQGKSENDKIIFYSSLYRTLLMPVDRTGENPLWKSNEPYYDDFYAIWDTYRTLSPLLAIYQPSRQSDIVRAMIDIYKNEGYMPDARSGNCNGRTQGGSNCDMVVADAYVKGLTGIDYQLAYKAMIKNAEVPPGGNEQKEGRGAIQDYNKLGYITMKYERAGTRVVEYSANDFAIATVAKGLGKEADYLKYKSRANNWQNLWRDTISEGARGFIWPKDENGKFIDTLNQLVWGWPKYINQKFDLLTAGSWKDFFYESHSWEYSLYIPHDVKTLIGKCGGNERFVARLDTFFNKKYYNIWNEPGFLTPCLYNYAGRQDKTAYMVDKIIKQNYNTSRKGVPGNDDSGSMASWYAFHAMGFFPNAGQDVYLISKPTFEKTTINLENGKQFTIIAKKLTDKNIYIQSATLNGKPYAKNWFTHKEILNGGVFEFEMGSKPTSWGSKDLPPSMNDDK